MTAINIIIVIALIFLIAFIYIAISMWKQESRNRGEYLDSMQQDIDEFNGLLADILHVNEQQLKSQNRFSESISRAAGIELADTEESEEGKQATEAIDSERDDIQEDDDKAHVAETGENNNEDQRRIAEAYDNKEITEDDAGEYDMADHIIEIFPEQKPRIKNDYVESVQQETEKLLPDEAGRNTYLSGIKKLCSKLRNTVACSEKKETYSEEQTQPGEAQTLNEIYTLITDNQVKKPENEQFPPARKQSLKYDVGRSGKVYTVSELEALIKE